MQKFLYVFMFLFLLSTYTDAMGGKKKSKKKKSSSTTSSNSGTSNQSNSSNKYPSVKSSFQYQLSGSLKNYSANVVFLDLFETSSSQISSLKSQGKKVFCYFSAGTSESWREDYNRIPNSIKGNSLEDWPGERWLNTKDSATLNLAKSRLDKAVSKKCDGVDPDNVDAYDNDTGFSISKNDSKSFLQKLATEAHNRGLLIGLKNSAEIASSLSGTMDWVVAEECFKYGECGSYASFISKNKPVFIVEYSTSQKSAWCSSAKSQSMSLIFSNYDLNGSMSTCP
ncbi:MAG: endo alpha-1,4 polygalactosaminidase [Proteobacteria bacterium]|nr:endo alpha-1,4 polygalactosaminidase [Pseudomonadota bacterium]